MIKSKNHLSLARKKRGFRQKQIAALLGHNTTDQISRYERGAKLPNLKTALKLGMIYHIPIRVLFYGYHEMCRNEMEKQAKNSEVSQNISDVSQILTSDGTEFCTYAEKLNSVVVKQGDLDSAGRHVVELVRLRGEKSGHFTKRK